MKRIAFVFALFLIFAFDVVAQEYEQGLSDSDSVIPIKFYQTAEASLGFNTMQGYEPSPVYFSAFYNIVGNRFAAGGGTRLEKGDLQLTLNASYKFFKREKVSLGTGIIYNLNWLQDFSISNNFLPGFYFTYSPCSFYSLELDADFFFKVRKVFALHNDLSSLINTTLAFSLRNDFYLPDNFLLYFDFASIEQFRYMILCAPSFIFGGQYSGFENLELWLEAAVHYIDFFTLSAHYDDTEIRLGVRYKW